MNKTLLNIGGLLLGAFAVNEFNKRKKPVNRQITRVSDCDIMFREFNKRINISLEKKANLQKAHQTIRKKIREYFRHYTNLPIPSFYIQGSYKNGTLIENTNFKSDIDLGIYFPYNPGVSVETIQSHIKKALLGHTRSGITIKRNCVRLNYIRDFHIDLPIYFINEENGDCYHGERGKGWLLSDPKDFNDWLNDITYYNPQILRIIRYVKAWAERTKSTTGRKMLSGLSLTLLVIDNYKKDKRDDVAFSKTIIRIYEDLKEYLFVAHWKVLMPVEPYDNTVNRLNNSQKKFFLKKLETLIDLCEHAVTCKKRNESIRIWSRVFGQRFIRLN